MLWTQQTTLMNHSVMHQLYVLCSLIRWQKMVFHRQLVLSNVFCLMKACVIIYFFNKGHLLDGRSVVCHTTGPVMEHPWVHVRVFSHELIHVAGHQPLIPMLPVEEVGVYFHRIKSVERPTLPTQLAESVTKVNEIEYPYSSLWRRFPRSIWGTLQTRSC